MSSIALWLSQCSDHREHAPQRPTAPARRPRPMPPTLSNDPDLQRHLAEKFEAVSGNASVEDARIIGLGERHFRTRRRNGQRPPADPEGFQSLTSLAHALSWLSQDGDLVLLEGIDRTRGRMRAFPFLHLSLAFSRDRKLTAQGWDDEVLALDEENVRERGKQRNEAALYPTIEEANRDWPADKKIFVVSGVAHFTDDRRIDDVMQRIRAQYLLLGEKRAMALARELHLVE